jgi:hypothetical protein
MLALSQFGAASGAKLERPTAGRAFAFGATADFLCEHFIFAFTAQFSPTAGGRTQ